MDVMVGRTIGQFRVRRGPFYESSEPLGRFTIYVLFLVMVVRARADKREDGGKGGVVERRLNDNLKKGKGAES